MKSRFVLESGGFALLLVLPFVFPLLVPGSLDLFHHRFTFANPLTGILLNIGFFFVVGIVTCLATSRLPQFPRSLASGSWLGLCSGGCCSPRVLLPTLCQLLRIWRKPPAPNLSFSGS